MAGNSPTRKERHMQSKGHGEEHRFEEAPEYRAPRLRRALAEDPRTAELGVQVDVRGEHAHLSGTVSGQADKDQLDQVLHEQEPRPREANDVRPLEGAEPPHSAVLR